MMTLQTFLSTTMWFAHIFVNKSAAVRPPSAWMSPSKERSAQLILHILRMRDTPTVTSWCCFGPEPLYMASWTVLTPSVLTENTIVLKSFKPASCKTLTNPSATDCSHQHPRVQERKLATAGHGHNVNELQFTLTSSDPSKHSSQPCIWAGTS